MLMRLLLFLTLLLVVLLAACATTSTFYRAPRKTQRQYQHRQRVNERDRARLRDQKLYRPNFFDSL